MRANGTDLEGNDQFKGYSMDLIDGIAKIIGFEYEFRLAKDGKYGNYDKNLKRWTGLVGDLLERVKYIQSEDFISALSPS